MKDNVEVLLEDAGARWRSGQPDPGEPNWPGITTRSKRPLWVAAAAVVIIGVVAAFLVAPGDKAAPAHVRSAPIVQPLVPYVKGATVPPPMVAPISHPRPIYCPARDLTGSVDFHGTTGVLTLELRAGVKEACALPTMLYGSTALRFIDSAGRTRSAGENPESMVPTNPPSYWFEVVLKAGQRATMYLQQRDRASCPAPISRAVIRYDDSNLDTPLTIPVTGARYCGNYLYGPFTTPGHAVAFENPGWRDLYGTLDFPARITDRHRITYRITLTNHGRGAVPLQPCTKYRLGLTNTRRGADKYGPIGCDPKKPVVIQPGKSISLLFSYTPINLPRGKYTVEWAIAGMTTVHAETTIG